MSLSPYERRLTEPGTVPQPIPGIIDCPSCKQRHGRRYVCDERLEILERIES